MDQVALLVCNHVVKLSRVDSVYFTRILLLVGLVLQFDLLLFLLLQFRLFFKLEFAEYPCFPFAELLLLTLLYLLEYSGDYDIYRVLLFPHHLLMMAAALIWGSLLV